ncbi:MAG: hypothetical protein M2R45_03105 [Verrucomicrobia subdivision 3 bacterium]|nr:hypothetical protein [Limisphaerales bacterium]MCS1413173.1 hypothetical protein [Limisphaerales bacterium]
MIQILRREKFLQQAMGLAQPIMLAFLGLFIPVTALYLLK